MPQRPALTALRLESPEEAASEGLRQRSLLPHLLYLLVIVSLARLGWLAFEGLQQSRQEVTSLQARLEVYKKGETRLHNVQRTLQMAYDHLTPWDVEYYSNIFVDFSERYGLPWEAYAALVRYESNFNPAAKSVSGAKGMVQVMPKTGEEIASRIGIRWRKNHETLWNDLHNMVIGFVYFSEGFKEAVTQGYSNPQALQYSFRRYVSGIGDNEHVKVILNNENQEYVKEYRTSLWLEFKKLMLYHHSVCTGEDPVLAEYVDIPDLPRTDF